MTESRGKEAASSTPQIDSRILSLLGRTALQLLACLV